MSTSNALANSLATELSGRVVDFWGEKRVIVRGDIIYAALGKVKLDHRGRVTTLGVCSDGAAQLADAYRSAVAEVARR